MNGVCHLLVAGIVLVLVANDETGAQRRRYVRRNTSCRYRRPEHYEATYNRLKGTQDVAKLRPIFYRCWRAATARIRHYKSLPVCNRYTRRNGMACRRTKPEPKLPKSQCRDKEPSASCDKYAKAGRCAEEDIADKCERACRACPEFGPLDELLKAIGVDRLPNVSIDDIPGLRDQPHVRRMIQNAGVIRKERAATMHSVTISATMDPKGLFYDVRQHLSGMQLKAARLLVHMKEAPRPSNVQIKIYKVTDGKRGSMPWVSHGISAGQTPPEGDVNVTRLVKEWLQQAGNGPLALYVTAEKGGQQMAMVAADGEHATLLTLDMYKRPDEMSLRSRRSSTADCGRKDNWVLFDEVGGRSIVEPRHYNAYQCTGSCYVKVGSGKQPPGFTPARQARIKCCHGTDYAGMEIVYVDKDHAVKTVALPNAVIQRCVCGDWSNIPIPDFWG